MKVSYVPIIDEKKPLNSAEVMNIDSDFRKVVQFLDDGITSEEIELYKAGKIRKLWHNHKTMIAYNCDIYTRIMNLLTLAYHKYTRLPNGKTWYDVERYPDIPQMFNSYTPTRLYYAVNVSRQSTIYEIAYGWFKKISPELEEMNRQDPKEAVRHLIKELCRRDKLFDIFYRTRNAITGERDIDECLRKDKTDDIKIKNVLFCFHEDYKKENVDTKDVVEYVTLIKDEEHKLRTAINNAMADAGINKDTFRVYVFNNEWSIMSNSFSITTKAIPMHKPKKFEIYNVTNEEYTLSKTYNADAKRCIRFEHFLSQTFGEQMNWLELQGKIKKIESRPDTHPDGTANRARMAMKKYLLTYLKTKHFSEIFCYKRHSAGAFTKISFKGVFKNVYVIEQFYYILNDKINLNDTRQTCMSIENAVDYILDRGYYVFGDEFTMGQWIHEPMETKLDVSNHWLSLCPTFDEYMAKLRVQLMRENDDEINYARVRYEHDIDDELLIKEPEEEKPIYINDLPPEESFRHRALADMSDAEYACYLKSLEEWEQPTYKPKFPMRQKNVERLPLDDAISFVWYKNGKWIRHNMDGTKEEVFPKKRKPPKKEKVGGWLITGERCDNIDTNNIISKVAIPEDYDSPPVTPSELEDELYDMDLYNQFYFENENENLEYSTIHIANGKIWFENPEDFDIFRLCSNHLLGKVITNPGEAPPGSKLLPRWQPDPTPSKPGENELIEPKIQRRERTWRYGDPIPKDPNLT